MIKKLDDAGLFSCRFTADLFEYSTRKHECSSKVFIKAFVYSSVSKSISSKSYLFESKDINLAYDLIKKEKKLNKGKDIYPSYVMSWIGYIMQYFTLTTDIPLTTLYKNMKPEEFYMLYESYHSMDNDLVVKRICESKNINLNFNDLDLFRSINGKLQ